MPPSILCDQQIEAEIESGFAIFPILIIELCQGSAVHYACEFASDRGSLSKGSQ